MSKRVDHKGLAIVAVAAVVATSSLLGWVVTRRRRKRTLLSPQKILSLRKHYFSSSLSISYENSNPLVMVQGEGSRLIDDSGVSYLDTRNNVAHVGHSHPYVAAAICEQVQQLNTNTRYLHPTMAQLAERLAKDYFPYPLDTVFFCNSGSEANDLALRLADAHVSQKEALTICVDRAYHGHTLATLQVSPYKFSDNMVPEGIRVVPCPDVYRGPHCDPATAGPKYAQDVVDICDAAITTGHKVRAMIVEGGMSVAGVILPPRGYLATCAAAVRRAGGLYIADEVQTGFGRLGSSMWAFQYEHESPRFNDTSVVVPDIVTVGKPFGNGMPLAAVVTAKKVARAFESKGIEYFNTFGGNPVSAAAGMAMLDVLEKNKLQAHAYTMGVYLKKAFTCLKERGVTLIGDIRGSGLFLGIELVTDGTLKTPATSETSFICSQLKEKHCILTSIDGPHDNVLVIKPPMVFNQTDADFFFEKFHQVATVDLPSNLHSLESMGRTPT